MPIINANKEKQELKQATQDISIGFGTAPKNLLEDNDGNIYIAKSPKVRNFKRYFW